MAGEASSSEPYQVAPFDAQFLDLQPAIPESIDTDDLFGISGDWDPMPRLPRSLNPTSEAFANLTAKFVPEDLRQNDLCKVIKAISIDLEGDGTDETILAMKVRGAVWDYAAGTPVMGAAWMVAAIRDGESNYLGGIIVSESAPAPSPEWQLVGMDMFPVDVNGDGVIEIVIHEKYYEAEQFYVYSVGETQSEKLLTYGYGL